MPEMYFLLGAVVFFDHVVFLINENAPVSNVAARAVSGAFGFPLRFRKPRFQGTGSKIRHFGTGSNFPIVS
jgi:hypothetical protein